jgi:putative ABC transport system permease protein
MRLTDIALLNLRRRKGKAIFLVAGLLIAVSTVVTMRTLVEAMTQDINHKLEKFGANILIVPKTETLSLSYGGMSLGGVSFEMEELLEADLAKIADIENAGNVAAVGPLVLGVAEIGDKRVLSAGVDTSVVGILKPWWKVEGELPGPDEVMPGVEAARILGLARGDTLFVAGRELTVSGILASTGSQDDQLLFTDLKTAQTLFGKEGRVSMVEVAALCKDCPIDDMVSQLSGALPSAKVMAIQQVVKGRMAALGQLKKFSLGVSAVMLFVGSLMVLVTMMGSVRERTSEIGVFRALGFRKSHVVQIIFTESACLSLVAGVLGYPLGLLITKLALPAFTEGRAVALPLDPMMAAGAVGLALLLGLVSSAYPALAATRLDPNEALRAL